MSDAHCTPRPSGQGPPRMRIPFFSLLDRRDEGRARALRADLGLRGKIVSWHRDEEPRGPSRWIARVSCPDWPDTVEGRGLSRCRAIRAADEALTGAVAFGPIG